LNKHIAALAQGATDAMPASASSRKRCRHLHHLLLISSTSNPQGKRFPAGILVSPAFIFLTGEIL
jgi:hypothetical protein